VTETLNTRRRVGATDLFLPPFAWEPAPWEISTRSFRTRWRRGRWNPLGVRGRFYDTAAWYGGDFRKLRLGAFLRSKDRREYVLIPKVGRTAATPRDPALSTGLPGQADWVRSGLRLQLRGVMRIVRTGRFSGWHSRCRRTGTIHDLDHDFHEPLSSPNRTTR